MELWLLLGCDNKVVNCEIYNTWKLQAFLTHRYVYWTLRISEQRSKSKKTRRYPFSITIRRFYQQLPFIQTSPVFQRTIVLLCVNNPQPLYHLSISVNTRHCSPHAVISHSEWREIESVEFGGNSKMVNNLTRFEIRKSLLLKTFFVKIFHKVTKVLNLDF